MAARHLQKLRAAQVHSPVAPEDASLSEDEDVVAIKAPFNPFDLLSDEEVNSAPPCPYALHFILQYFRQISFYRPARSLLLPKNKSPRKRTVRGEHLLHRPSPKAERARRKRKR